MEQSFSPFSILTPPFVYRDDEEEPLQHHHDATDWCSTVDCKVSPRVEPNDRGVHMKCEAIAVGKQRFFGSSYPRLATSIENGKPRTSVAQKSCITSFLKWSSPPSSPPKCFLQNKVSNCDKSELFWSPEISESKTCVNPAVSSMSTILATSASSVDPPIFSFSSGTSFATTDMERDFFPDQRLAQQHSFSGEEASSYFLKREPLALGRASFSLEAGHTTPLWSETVSSLPSSSATSDVSQSQYIAQDALSSASWMPFVNHSTPALNTQAASSPLRTQRPPTLYSILNDQVANMSSNNNCSSSGMEKTNSSEDTTTALFGETIQDKTHLLLTAIEAGLGLGLKTSPSNGSQPPLLRSDSHSPEDGLSLLYCGEERRDSLSGNGAAVELGRENKPGNGMKYNYKNKPLNEFAVSMMEQWYQAHLEHPYPSLQEKEILAQHGNLTIAQVNSWFANRRNRSDNTRPKKNRKQLQIRLYQYAKELETASGGLICACDVTQRLNLILNEYLM